MGSTVFAFSLKYNSTIQFLFKIKLTGVGIMAEYILKSVKFSHRHNISFIWLAENTHKNPNIF